MTRQKTYLSIVSHYESCLEKHGDTYLGVDWPRKDDVNTRYRVMLEVIKPGTPNKLIRLLDFGCGASHLNEYILGSGMEDIRYAGLDISEKFVQLSRGKFPFNDFYCVDVLDDDVVVPNFDYVVMNGVFTEKNHLPFGEMLAYFKQVVKKVFALADRGLAFNVMSKHVDWEREDLFHLPLDTLADFLTKDLTRNFVIRNDYGLYEYTAYLYK